MAKKYNKKTFKSKFLDRSGLPKTSTRRTVQEAITIDLHNGWNFVSFPYKLQYTTLTTIIYPPTYPQITDIKTSGWGVAQASQVIDGAWVGSVTSIDPKKGYQIKSDGDSTITIDQPRGYGILYGDTDLKWTLPTGLSLVSFPYVNNSTSDYVSWYNALAFTNHGQNIDGGGTGEILEKVLGESVAMDYIDEEWAGSLEQNGFQYNQSYWFDIKNKPAIEPFRYFRDPAVSIFDYANNEYKARWQEHPIDGPSFNFGFSMGAQWNCSTTMSALFYKWSKTSGVTTLTKPVANEDWLGLFRGDVCVGSYFILANDWTANANGGLDSIAEDGAWDGGSNTAMCVVGQSNDDLQQLENGYAGDNLKWVFWDASEEKYYMCKWYDTVTQKVLEYDDPLGDGVYKDVSVYMFSPSMLSGMVNGRDYFTYDHYGGDVANALLFNYDQTVLPLYRRFALVAIPFVNPDGTYNFWNSTNQ